MDSFSKILLSIYGLAGLIVLILIIYLIFRRIEKKKNKTLGKRDN